MMNHECAPVLSIEPVGPDIYTMELHAPRIAAAVGPGQFVNVRVHDFPQPLLRRPFSVYRLRGSSIFLLFNIIGAGTRLLIATRIGGMLDLIGPLGRPFVLDDHFETAILVGGGLGVAPFPLFLQRYASQKKIAAFIGARTAGQVIDCDLPGAHIATDDGSKGFHGTVVDLLRREFHVDAHPSPRIFACGPNPMLRNLAIFAREMNIPCEVSLESAMACGIGICQGCPVELTGGPYKYALVCKDGAVFDSRTVRIP